VDPTDEEDLADEEEDEEDEDPISKAEDEVIKSEAAEEVVEDSQDERDKCAFLMDELETARNASSKESPLR
jgi:hypothetical protein